MFDSWRKFDGVPLEVGRTRSEGTEKVVGVGGTEYDVRPFSILRTANLEAIPSGCGDSGLGEPGTDVGAVDGPPLSCEEYELP